MTEEKALPEEIAVVFEALKSELIWLHGRWIIFEQLYGASPERVEMLNQIASTYFFVTQEVLLNDILISIGRLTDKPRLGKNDNLSIGQIASRLDNIKYPELTTRLEEHMNYIETLCKPIRAHRNKKLAHRDFDLALKNAEPLPTITIKAIKDTLEVIRIFMNECEVYFRDSETAYEAFAMKADGNSLISSLKKAVAYDELEEQGFVERGYWRRKSRYKGV
jgi:hypothetical protein